MAGNKNSGRVVTAPTPLQKRGVDLVLSGKYNHVAPALREAGYSSRTALAPQKNFFKAQGVQVYLKTLSKVAKKRWNLSIADKVAMTYLDGLGATRLFGKNAIEHPDWIARKSFADTFAQFFGWTRGETNTKMQQFNFFSVDEKTKNDFNESFKVFLRQL